MPIYEAELVIVAAMSAFGPKRTLRFAPHMSAFGGKADTTTR